MSLQKGDEHRALSESSSLLLSTKEGDDKAAPRIRRNHQQRRQWFYPSRIDIFVAAAAVLLFAGSVSWYSPTLSEESPARSNAVAIETPLEVLSSSDDAVATTFPNNFVWGAATSSYQIEGATQQDGRGPSVWDTFVAQQPSPILDNSTGDIACDHYHRVQQDVALMAQLNLTAYRFSIAWSRILPNGNLAGGINMMGIEFYNHLIDTLLAHHIVPYVTLFHWDTPQALPGGWLNAHTAHVFAHDYATTAFSAFGDRVQHWITVNEPWTVAVNGYSSGIHAPGHQSPTEPYMVAHHLLLAHAKATRIYRQHFQPVQQGVIGIANCGDFRYPARADEKSDRDAAERAMLFQFGWFVDPLFYGDYPAVMRERVGDRLPVVSEEERRLFLEASTDFLGLNYYSAFLATTPKQEANYTGYWADIHVDSRDRPEWKHNAMGWNVVPDGLYEMLLWVSNRYSNPKVFITENGSAENEPDLETSLSDKGRRAFLEDHIRACAHAIGAGVHLLGYFAWSLMDNFEWQFGYQRRFGLYHVDFETLERTPKESAMFYRSTIIANGGNIRLSHDKKRSNRRTLARRQVRTRELPPRVLIGYASSCCDAVRVAVRRGTNVVIWAFVGFEPSNGHIGATMTTNLNVTAIKEFIRELDSTGYGNVIHLVSVGGWNGPHLNPSLSAQVWYNAFKANLGGVVHGIDWDLEGNDDLTSPFNLFTVDCLEKMGEISRLAHEDGYIVTMAPPQSYLDVHGSSAFSRQVNRTDPDRGWHADFPYFGRNVYAYMLQRFGTWIDLVSIQFYESYSRAGQAVWADGTQPSTYLVRFVQELVSSSEYFLVDFSQDADIHMGAANVSLPLSKLVLGFANGWAADTTDEKTLFIPAVDVGVAWNYLLHEQQVPRGFMFWTIDAEGLNGIYLARELGLILNPPSTEDASS